ncbi:MAG: hypothetical protein JXO22_04645, partial [Phycisphaerae bacterium]|nr:hypothetical protein [Phycisphaerae bacterium]
MARKLPAMIDQSYRVPNSGAASNPRRRHTIRAASILPALLVLALCTTGLAEQVLQVGDVKAVVRPYGNGLAIYRNGVEISSGSSMVVTTPPWTPHFLLGPQSGDLESAERAEIEDGVELHIHHRGQHGAFLGEDTIRVRRDGRVERELVGEFTKDDGEALIQWRCAALNPVLIVGRPYRAVLRDGTEVIGVVPVEPKTGSADATALAKDFTSIEFDSRLGPLCIEVESNHALICYDFRGSRWADPSRPLFWFGDLGTRFKKGQPLHYRMTYHLPSADSGARQRTLLQGHARPQLTETAQTGGLPEPFVIVPRPKEATFDGSRFAIPASKTAKVIAGPTGEVRPLATLAIAELKRHLRDNYGLEFPQATVDDIPRIHWTMADESLPSDGYTLEVDDTGITLGARSPNGFLYAVQTLKQLMARGDAGEILVRGAR